MSKNSTKEKRKVGRPSKYKPEYCEGIIQFFDKEPYREVEEILTYKSGAEKTCYKMVANDLPFFSQYARSIGVTCECLLEWTRIHEEFSEAYKKAKNIQKEILITNGLQNLYSTAFACFTAKNITDMRDVQHIDTKIDITITQKLLTARQRVLDALNSN